MDVPIILIDSDESQCRELCSLLEGLHYQTVAIPSLGDLKSIFQKGAYKVVILDLDTVPVDNRVIKELKRQMPSISILGISSRKFHPELEEAIGVHFYASLEKPIDPSELGYWLKSIYENGDSKEVVRES